MYAPDIFWKKVGGGFEYNVFETDFREYRYNFTQLTDLQLKALGPSPTTSQDHSP